MKKSLRKLLKKYKEIEDFIIFGSSVKGKHAPKDIDIAIVMGIKDISLAGKAKDGLKEWNPDVEIIRPEEVYSTRLGMALISEGFSIKDNRYLRDGLGISPMKIYTYEIKHLEQVKKVLFGRGLNNFIKESKGIKLGAGCVMVPVHQSSKFEDFLDTWGLKHKAKEYLVL